MDKSGTQRKNDVIDLVLGYAGSMLCLFGVIMFNGYVLMSLPLILRMAAMIVTYTLIAAVPVIVMAVRRDKPDRCGFTREKLPSQIIIGVAVGAVMSLVLTLIPHIAGFGQYVDSGKRYVYAWQFVYEFVYCGAVGFTEELIFRGFVYDRVKRLFGTDTAAVIGSSILFGLFHIFGGNIIQILTTALIGAALCLCRLKIKNCSTLSLMTAHGVYDAMITVWACLFLG